MLSGGDGRLGRRKKEKAPEYQSSLSSPTDHKLTKEPPHTHTASGSSNMVVHTQSRSEQAHTEREREGEERAAKAKWPRESLLSPFYRRVRGCSFLPLSLCYYAYDDDEKKTEGRWNLSETAGPHIAPVPYCKHDVCTT